MPRPEHVSANPMGKVYGMEQLSIEDLRARAGKLPRVSLTHLPTPFLECPSLGKHLGVRLFFKRDDLTTLGCGGNKIRKLEFGIGEALASGCDVIEHGLAGQSNYCRQTAAAAAKCGLKCVLVLQKDHNYASRAWPSDHPAFVMMTEEAKSKLAQDPDWYAKGRG